MRSTGSVLVLLGLCVTASCYPDRPADFEAGTDDAATTLPDGAEVIPEFNNCTQSSFVERTGETDTRTIAFGSTGGEEFGFTPPCMVVAAGQTVHFAGDFSIHPLRPGTGPAAMSAGSPDNPILPTTSGSGVDVEFATPGTYPFYCAMHYASGMSGVVHVR